MRVSIKMAVEANEEPTLVHIEADYTPGRPGRRYMSNGDPGYPDEPDEIEITECTLPSGDEYELSPSDYECACGLIVKKYGDTKDDFDA